MKGQDLAEAMATAMDRVVSAREGASALDRAIEAIVGTMGRFDGTDATSYLAAYRAEMLMRDIPEDRRLAGFPRVAMPSIHAEVLEVRDESRDWEEFRDRLLEKYGHDDALRLSKRDFMEWVDAPGKGRNAAVLLREFDTFHATLDAGPNDTGHEPCPAIRKVGKRKGPGADGISAGNRRRADHRLERGEEGLRPV